MLKKIIKVAFWTTLGLATGLVGLGALVALEEADYPLE
jgi:hypothetical protein